MYLKDKQPYYDCVFMMRKSSLTPAKQSIDGALRSVVDVETNAKINICPLFDLAKVSLEFDAGGDSKEFPKQ